eukprot:5140198-Prorocentrum_lima.AAC.1
MQDIQDTENRIALAHPRTFDVVANLQAEKKRALQEATTLLPVTREEEFHQKEMVSVLGNTVRELTDEM